ncbi:uncharacterized protein P884DRAFT_81812 [Thermothelomyces heterothallicus CBS 202.75]|uniref:uncharacterized protein n=1 Tax=Thermothelomyces heterothallicus CBS 202.75 TaxID=1149848 RepID=UPI0037430262
MASPSQVAPSWLARLDEMAADIIPSTYPIETDTLSIIKKLLLAQGDDNAAVGEAVHEIRSFYTTKLFPPNDPFYRDLPDHGVSRVVGAVVDHVFELASAVPWKEPAHKRLADLLIALKENATTTGFDPAVRRLTLLPTRRIAHSRAELES